MFRLFDALAEVVPASQIGNDSATGCQGHRFTSPRVFEKFLQNLTGAGIPDELVTQLHKTLLEERAFTEKALKKVVLGDQSPP